MLRNRRRRIIDDFAHHPTAIDLTLTALKGKTPGRLIAVLDIRSNTMKMGAHGDKLAQALETADLVATLRNSQFGLGYGRNGKIC